MSMAFLGLKAKRLLRPGIVIALFAMGAAAAFAGGAQEAGPRSGGDTPAGAAAAASVRIVAAEDFYGDIAAQLAGSRARITSIMTDPNIDPHEYESTIENAKSVADANLVIDNGGGYDTWMDKLLSASPDPSRIVISGYEVAPVHLPENEHVWYGVGNVEAIAKAIREALVKLDPTHAAEFDANLATFVRSLTRIRDKMAEVEAKYKGTPIGLTETVFLYQALPMGLRVLTPFSFQKAISEGNDPPVDATLTAEAQVTEGKVRVLIYNAQTVNRITTKLLSEAKAEGIPVVPVTETMPPGMHYQSWMLEELDKLERTLGG